MCTSTMVNLTLFLSLELIWKKCPYWGRGLKPKQSQTQQSLVMLILFTVRIYVVHCKNQERLVEQPTLTFIIHRTAKHRLHHAKSDQL